MYKLAAPSWPAFSDKQQFPWHPLHLREHRDPALRYAGPQASSSRQVGPHTPSLSEWPPLKISYSKVCNSELKAPTETQPHRIPRETMRLLLTGKFHLICVPKYWFFCAIGSFLEQLNWRPVCIYLIRIWLQRWQSSWKWNESCSSQFAKLLQSQELSRYKGVTSDRRPNSAPSFYRLIWCSNNALSQSASIILVPLYRLINWGSSGQKYSKKN